MTANSRDLLDELIAFPTVSRDSNLALIDWCERYLDACGARTRRVYNADRTKANLYASLGPETGRGVMLSATRMSYRPTGRPGHARPLS